MILDRYIIRLWFIPFFTSLVVVIGVLLLGRALKVLGAFAESGVDWSVIGLLLTAILPYFLVLTVPMAAFFAMQTLLLRLQQDSELDAIRAAGISYVRLFRPLFVIALLLWAPLSYMAMTWMPEGQRAFQGLAHALQEMKAVPSFDAKRFNRMLDDFTVYIDGVDRGGRLRGFMLEDSRNPVPVVYMSESAEIEHVGKNLRFTLHHGTRLEGNGMDLISITFERYQVNIDISQLGMLKLPANYGSVLSMDLDTLWEKVKVGGDHAAIAEWHRRLILPTSVIVLMLFAFPLSIEPKRSGRAGAYIVGVTLLLAFYNMQIALHHQVFVGNLPWWSMWLGQLVMAVIGLDLSRRAASDHLPAPLAWLGEFFYLLHHSLQKRFVRRHDLRD
ncbi:MAG: LptF/LptG family permease [Mariprofundaceae bacterium]